MGQMDKELIKEIVESVKKEIAPDFLELKQKIETVNLMQKVNWKEEFGENIKKLLVGDYKNLSTKAVATSNVAGVIPEEWLAQVYAEIPNYGAAFQAGLRKIPVAEVLNYGKLGTDVTVYWQTENTAPTEAAPTITKASVSLETLIGLITLSNQSLKYSNVDLVNYFTQRFVYAVAGVIDDEVFNGTGSGSYKFTGIINATGVNTITFEDGKTSFSDITYDYLLKAIHSVNSNHLNGAGWFMSNSVLGLIHRKVLDTTGRPIFDYNTKTLLGYPVYLTDKLPTEGDDAAGTAFIVFGNIRDGMLYGAENLEVAASSDSAFSKNAYQLRVTQDTAIAVGLATIYSVIKTAAS